MTAQQRARKKAEEKSTPKPTKKKVAKISKPKKTFDLDRQTLIDQLDKSIGLADKAIQDCDLTIGAARETKKELYEQREEKISQLRSVARGDAIQQSMFK